MINPMLDKHYGRVKRVLMFLSLLDESTPMVGINSVIVPFIACGDLSGFDSDMNYEFDENYVYHEAVQKPINPPYKTAVQMKRTNQLDDSSSPTRRSGSSDLELK